MPEPEYWKKKWEVADRDLASTKLAFNQMLEDNRKLRDRIKQLKTQIHALAYDMSEEDFRKLSLPLDNKQTT